MNKRPTEADYHSRVNAHGGSKKGRVVRVCPREMKLFAYKWAIENIGSGNESYFIHNPNAKARFVPRLWQPLIPVLKEKFPEQAERYFSGRWENAAWLILNRVHKMFYGNDGTLRYRGKSKEHPDNWS